VDAPSTAITTVPGGGGIGNDTDATG